MNDLTARMQHLDSLLNDAESAGDPASQARLQEIARGLLDLHGAALQRLLELVAAAGEGGAAIIDAAARDDVISPVLLLHGLHPLDLETRVRAALGKVAPYTASHGGHVELLAISDDGVVNLRMEGSCHGCPSSRVTLETAIEQEIYAAAPEVTSIVVEGLAEPEPVAASGFVPLDSIAINGSVAHAAVS
jgi:Fe-S cluster biogenesis protein NfuA